MHITGAPATLVLSPSDLSSFVGCRHRAGLDLAVAQGALSKPTWFDPAVQALRDRGAEHERQYVESLRAAGLTIVDVREASDPLEATREALARGVDVVVQGALAGDGWFGYPDILRRVDVPSALGPWSYEVYDTKLARETRGSTVLQLMVYSELLAVLQGRRPGTFHVVTPDPVVPLHAFRTDDYAAYYRLIVAQLRAALERPADDLQAAYYPEPVEQCDVCRWYDRCHSRRRADDHLSFVAGAGRLHRAELQAQGVATLAAAAAMPVPVPFKPSRGSRDTYGRIREQARVQHEARTLKRPVWELLAPPDATPTGKPEPNPDAKAARPRIGLERMPLPSDGDVFLDLEAARFAREGGREYLFGVWTSGAYRAWWAYTDAEERTAFETVMDLVMTAWARDPAMHVYHFGHYEPSAFRRLAGRHATRTAELDRLLRARRFIDLHTLTRQTLRAGVESYSIKQLEQFYGFARDAALRDVGMALHAVEVALEGHAPEVIPPDVRAAVETYNADDCRSTQALRDWLEGEVRSAALARGDVLTRPELLDGTAPEDTSEKDAEVEALRRRLLAGIEGDASDSAHPSHARWMLAYLIDWHRREERVAWWDYFRVRELVGEDALDETCVVAGLRFVARQGSVTSAKTGKATRTVIDRYTYPPQAIEIDRGDKFTVLDGQSYGTVDAHDRSARTIDIAKGPKAQALPEPDTLYATNVVPTATLQESVMRLAADPDAVTCGIDLLHRRPPRLRTGSLEPLPGETTVDTAVRLVLQLDRTTLAVQGPPGTGKTWVGAQMIRALVRAGKRVGVTAVSHRVIVNLLEAVRRQAVEAGEPVRLARKLSDGDEPGPGIAGIVSPGGAVAALRDGEVDVLGGTAWLWARADAAACVDVLVVDEAGQMSLANVLAVSPAADSLVLLGDPQQLEQPQKGSHPDGVDVSALQHVIGDAQTMPADRGLFMPVTWRLAPAVCRFTSEVFYEGKLEPRPELAQQRLEGVAPFDGAGLWVVPVAHTGNQNASLEEVEVVERIVSTLLAPGARWVTSTGEVAPLTAADLRVVSPYNAQVNRLAARLEPHGVPVGTVDRFQGQEGPVVIYSMATSHPDDAPRGMEFLYSLNRLNVATSRARCAAIVVASPTLFEPECRTPRQMRLASALCRFRELATEVPQASG